MRLSYLASSPVVVEDEGTAVLCDPWLLDGAFYGAWAHYPPLEFEPEAYADVDYIYVSHDDPDHFHRPTMRRLDSDTPVLLPADASRLAEQVEELGFETVELARDDRTRLGDDLHLTLFGDDGSAIAGDLDPGWRPESPTERTAPPTAVFDDGETTLVHATDTQWPPAERARSTIAERYDSVDLLTLPYTASNCYPQCVTDYSHEEKLRAREAVIGRLYREAESLLEALAPDYFVPVGGDYVLSGDLADRNQYLAAPTRSEVFWQFVGSDLDADPILLDSEASFDLETGTPSAPYTPIDRAERREYAEGVLAQRSFPYQHDDHPSVAELTELLDRAYEQMEETRQTIGWESDTRVVLDLSDDLVAALSMAGDGYELTSPDAVETGDAVRFSMDDRLLARILRGEARFDHAQVGSHVEIRERPRAGDRPLSAIVSSLRA